MEVLNSKHNVNMEMVGLAWSIRETLGAFSKSKPYENANINKSSQISTGGNRSDVTPEFIS